MSFNQLNKTHIRDLKSMVSPDRFSTGESNLDLHAKDQSRHKPCRPEAVMWPATKDEVSGILQYADSNRIPVTGWGSGSSLEGNPIPLERGIVLDFSRMNRILDLRVEDFQADVEPGVIYQDLNKSLRHQGLFFPPDPGARATIGGMIANNASGTRTVRYGSTRDHVLRLSMVLANGQILEVGSRVSKSSSGYDLLHLLIGSEGTLGLVVGATLRLVGLPEAYSAAIVTFSSVDAAGGAVYEIMRAGLDPAALEMLSPECIELINREEGLGLAVSTTLFMEFHGPGKGQLAETLDMVREICHEKGCGEFRLGLEREERDRFLKARHELGEMIIRTHPDRAPISLDVAVPITAYPVLIALARKEAEQSGIPGYIFSHAGDGNIHLVFMGKRDDPDEWARIDQVDDRMVSKALELGGTATGEHGVGMGKKKFMAAEHGKSLEWMKQIKSLFDPNGILNPGKIFP